MNPNSNLTKGQMELIPDLVKLLKIAHEMDTQIPCVTTRRIRNDNYLEPDYMITLLGIDCYSSDMLYAIKKSSNINILEYRMEEKPKRPQQSFSG